MQNTEWREIKVTKLYAQVVYNIIHIVCMFYIQGTRNLNTFNGFIILIVCGGGVEILIVH